MTAEDDRVAVEAESEGAHVSGATYRNQYHFFMRFRDGKLTQFKEYMDTERVTDILCGGQRPTRIDDRLQSRRSVRLRCIPPRAPTPATDLAARKGVGEGRRGSVRGTLGGRRKIKKNTQVKHIKH